MTLNLRTNIENISNVGKITAKRLNMLGIKTIQDLCFYFPFRYDEFFPVESFKNAKTGEKINFVGAVELIENRKSARKRIYITEALVANEKNQIKVIWFNQPFIKRNLCHGDIISVSGKLDIQYGSPVLKSPVYEKYSAQAKNNVHTQGLIPNYHLTANLTQKQIRFLIKQAIHLADEIKDWLPESVIKRQVLLPLSEAIKKIHFPENTGDVDKARRRLAFNELFLLQLQSRMIKNKFKDLRALPIKFFEKKTKEFVESLPFKLTDSQKRSAWRILMDMEKKRPMTRLLQGDVGSGKTIVAVIALLNAAADKAQSVLMVPTEILAKQHFNNLSKLLKNTKIKIGLITRSEKKLNHALNEKKKISLDDVLENSGIIIGTHALIQKKINFRQLALAVIDEQHRFGVEQRKTLVRKNKSGEFSPHLLSMTATPIPRSLALALYGDLDISVINEMPQGRKKIITRLVKESGRPKAYSFIKGLVGQGRQVFVICPLIDVSDKLGVRSVKEEYKKLNEKIFPELKIAMLHGRMKSAEKSRIMENFLKNQINILVSTSVVEVGLDVPNASVMMIEGADRFGLAQLHQFRGRVGRGREQSFCFLFTDSEADKTIERLNALEKNHNGIDLAKIDLKFRGPGEIFGTSQKGFPELKMASLFDYELMKKANEEVKGLIDKKIDLSKFPELEKHTEQFINTIHQE